MRRAEMMILVIIFIAQTPYVPTFNALPPILTKVICNGRGIVNKYEPFCVDNGGSFTQNLKKIPEGT